MADVTAVTGHAALIDRAVRALGGLDIVLVGHGFLPDQRETEHSWDAAETTLAVNFVGTVALLLPVVDTLERQGFGQLAVITSVAAERGRPRNYTYGAAKAGLNVYLQGVRSRLYRSGATVHVLKPGPVHSPMTVGHTPNVLFATPEQIASGILSALASGRSVAWLPAYWRPIMAVVRWLPEPIFQRLPFLSGR